MTQIGMEACFCLKVKIKKGHWEIKLKISHTVKYNVTISENKVATVRYKNQIMKL